jgi:hypothetical protein
MIRCGYEVSVVKNFGYGLSVRWLIWLGVLQGDEWDFVEFNQSKVWICLDSIKTA